MFDIFNKKRIAAQDKYILDLIREMDDIKAELRAEKNRTEYLVRTIRDMDQEIFNMGQRTDWSGMRPHFQKLHEEMTSRKVAESKRINSLLMGEIIDSYKPKQIGNG